MRYYAGLSDHRKDKGIRRKPPKIRPAPAPRYVARHGLLHAVKVPNPIRGRLELRYVTDEQLAALGLSC